MKPPSNTHEMIKKLQEGPKRGLQKDPKKGSQRNLRIDGQTDTSKSNDEKTKAFTLEMLRLRTKKYLSTTFAGWLYDWILLCLSIFSCFQFIYQTFLTDRTESERNQQQYFKRLEEILASLFMFDWCLSFFIADHKITHIMSFFSMVDLLTVIPIWITRNTSCPHYSSIQNFADFLVYIVCGLSTTRILRALRIRKKLISIEDEVQRCLGEIALVLSVMLLFNSGVMQYLESEVQPLAFQTWMYYMCVTVTTVGYGDISPKTELGRLAVIAMIGFAIVTIPKLTNELIEKMNLQSYYARASFIPKGIKSQHVVITGDIRSCVVQDFFAELFHEDHENANLHAVLLFPYPPSFDMLMLLNDPIFSFSVTYLEGTALNEKDIRRARLDSALAVFIMCNKFHEDPDQEDSRSILQQHCIRRYLASLPPVTGPNNTPRHSGPWFCMQLIRPENRRHISKSSGIADSESNDIILCMNEIKFGVMAKALMFPGINTLIMNLLTSFADDDDDENEITKPKDPELQIENLDDEDFTNWLREYQMGCGWEIYTTELADCFEGLKFSTLSELLYQRMGIILFAVEIEDLKKDKANTKILINPGDFVIPPKDEYRVEAFVIARNKAESDLSNNSQEEDYESNKVQINKFNSVTSAAMIFRNQSSEEDSAAAFNSNNAKTSGRMSGSSKGTGNNSNNNKKKDKFKWQVLMKKYQSSAQNALRVKEESQQRDEDNLRRNYFMRIFPIEYSEVLVQTSVTNEYPLVSNHIIIASKTVHSLYDFILPLRAKSLTSIHFIVVLCSEDISPSEWRRLALFQSILVVKGSPTEESDLIRAGIFRAVKVVVLSSISNGTSKDSSSGVENTTDDLLVDSDAIFAYYCVRRLNEDAQVIVEIIRHENIDFLKIDSSGGEQQSGGTSNKNYIFSPQFASGALFTANLLDALVCQAFFSPRLIKLLNVLIVDTKDSLDSRGAAEITTTIPIIPPSQPASGPVPLTRMPSQMIKTKSLVTLLSSSQLYLINIPDNLESRTFGALYKYFAKVDVIPIGLLRGTYAHMRVGPKGNNLPYVFTNPNKDSELFSCDRVFVLSPKPIAQSKSAQAETNKSLLGDKVRRNIAEDTASTVFSIRDDVVNLDVRQNAFEASLNDIKEDFNVKLNTIMGVLRDVKEIQRSIHNPVNNNNNSNNTQLKTRQFPGSK